MANVLYEENDVQDIAYAIREQNGTTETYNVSEMGDAVRCLGTPIDSELSETSTNPVQNKVLVAKFNELTSSTANTTDNKIGDHNTSESAHNDIRLLITDVITKLNNFLDVDDTKSDQLSEVLTLINNNKGTLESLTTSKINVSAIVDNLTTSDTSKVLSAKQGVAIKSLIDGLQGALTTLETTVGNKANSSDLTAHTGNKENPHGVTAAQVGLGNVNNTSDTDKPVSTAQATAIADAKKAGTDAQTNLTSHTGNKENPHGVNLTQLGVTASADEVNYTKGVKSAIQTQLDKKANDFSIELYNGTSGNPKPVRFMTVNYSTCGSENGVAIKVSMVSGHGNGSSYAFLQDAIIKVSHTGTVEVDNFKYYGASAGTYDEASRQYGDIFWVIDTTNTIVDFYCLMGQYARVQMTPFKRVTYSTGGTITQYTSCTVYSTGDKVWGNNDEFALKSDLSGIDLNGYATTEQLSTLQSQVDQLTASVVTVHSGNEEPIAELGEDGDIYLVTI